MESVYVGWLSILPPVIAIVLALVTKEVISSLLVGILTGGLIYSFSVGTGAVGVLDATFTLMGEKMGGNINIIIFLSFLGALVALVTMAGGSKAYAHWAATKIKSKRISQLATCGLGILLFIDDYFNCLTTGTVMRPLTDRYEVSRAKLAYIIHSVAAPICIIAPISSWAVAVGSSLKESGAFESELSAFVATIPYNAYAILSIVMVIIMSATNFKFGPMSKFEKMAEAGDLAKNPDSAVDQMESSEKGKVYDLVLPIGGLVVFSIFAMLYTGGFFSGQGISIREAFGNCDSAQSIVYGGFVALLIALALYVPRKILSFGQFMGGIGEGIKSMVPAFIILTLAWTISGVCRDLLGTADFVGNLVAESNFPVALIPALLFLVAALLSFSMGTAWGTFGIIIPIVVIICQQAAPEFMIISLAATLGGSVFGDNCSPISDTTVLSATSSACNFMDHVTSQIPYSVTVAGSSFVGYIAAGFTGGSAIVLFVASGLTLAVATVTLSRIYKRKEAMEVAASLIVDN